MPAPHDRGGWPTAEPIDQNEHEWADWEHQTQALYLVLSRKGVMAVDELRAGIEALPADEHEADSCFERWSRRASSVPTTCARAWTGPVAVPRMARRSLPKP